MERKYVYWFEEGGRGDRLLLGSKGAGLAEMTRIGLAVPHGFTITTEACVRFYDQGGKFPDGLEDEIREHIAGLEEKTGKVFGGTENPLLVSVRSGAAVSMPGMMDTILNVGLNDASVEALARLTDNPRFALDCYRRFIQMFGDIVLGVNRDLFERVLSAARELEGVKHDYEISVQGLKDVIARYREIIVDEHGKDFSQDPSEQLIQAVLAVFRSWNTERAIVYRNAHKIPHDLGTAVNIQSMVFGNIGCDSGTGVMFTRNPSTGEKCLFGEYLVNAQGEDVVAGVRTPVSISRMAEDFPKVYRRILEVAERLENHYKDMQDIEFTIEQGKLFILQSRAGKRTAQASLEIARAMVKEDKITKEQALMRVSPEEITRLLHRGIDPNTDNRVLTEGLPASPGAAVGKVVFDSDSAVSMAEEKTILIRPDTKPDDMPGIIHAQGILTSRGGMTCHAAVVARGMGKPAVVGCEGLKIDMERRKAYVDDVVLKEGDIISIDGASGAVYLGEVSLVEPSMGDAFHEILQWADEKRVLGVKANADTPQDANTALKYGAEGIGLCRTEHMFMAQDRLSIVQEMILAKTQEKRQEALDKLLPIQRQDFYEILKAMKGHTVTIRLLDPPLHEFLPGTEELAVRLAVMKVAKAPEERITHTRNLLGQARNLQEMNPMMGLRGCRLGILWPEIYRMQVRAIYEAAVRLVKEGYEGISPEVMIPLVGIENELVITRKLCEEVAREVLESENLDIPIVIGTMLEIPRAALTADEIAKHAQFFSFGTNDLTQMTFGFSRDDAEPKFLHRYMDDGILKQNPFAVIDKKGVGKLIEIAVKLGKKERPDLVLGICGEHGGEPESIGFCHDVGLTYVSCSPFRVPVARLAAAQAAINNPNLS